jgi:hypothetical protein
MTRFGSTKAALTMVALGTCVMVAQGGQAPAPAAGQPPAAPAGRGNQTPAPMSFFVTSTPIGKGGNLGGLAGADAHCQTLATAAGAGNRTWRAYLSTQGAGAVNARDRIGKGPWHNVKGQIVARDLEHLHGDTLDLARIGNQLHRMTALTEKGDRVTGAGDPTNQHDILTGSQPDGRAFPEGKDMTCSSWTSADAGNAQVGHHDRAGGPAVSWNSVHPSAGCSQDALIKTGGNGFLYCFASGESK